MIDSDQSPATGDDFEIDLGDLTVDTDNTEETESTESTETESHSEETVQKKSGYVEFTEEQKPRVAEITRKRYEAERRAEALEKELAQYKKPPEPPKEVPVPNADPITEPDLFARQQHDRDKYIREHTTYEAVTEAQKQQQQAKEAEKFGSLVEKYNSNIEKLGVNPKSLKSASDNLAAAGIGKELTEFLLDDDQGPALVVYLDANPEDAEMVLGMSPARAASYIERNIRSKLSVKQTSKAPPPPTKISGIRTAGNVEADGTLYE